MGDSSTSADLVVVPFSDALRKRRRPAAAPDGARGELLLFTGVRYERYAETPPCPRLPGREAAGRPRRRR